SGRWDEAGITITATKAGDGYKLNGTKMFVLDGHTANLILVAARTDAGVSLFRVDSDASGLTRTPLATMDQTRKQATLEFSATPASGSPGSTPPTSTSSGPSRPSSSSVTRRTTASCSRSASASDHPRRRGGGGARRRDRPRGRRP